MLHPMCMQHECIRCVHASMVVHGCRCGSDNPAPRMAAGCREVALRQMHTICNTNAAGGCQRPCTASCLPPLSSRNAGTSPVTSHQRRELIIAHVIARCSVTLCDAVASAVHSTIPMSQCTHVSQQHPCHLICGGAQRETPMVRVHGGCCRGGFGDWGCSSGGPPSPYTVCGLCGVQLPSLGVGCSVYSPGVLCELAACPTRSSGQYGSSPLH